MFPFEKYDVRRGQFEIQTDHEQAFRMLTTFPTNQARVLGYIMDAAVLH